MRRILRKELDAALSRRGFQSKDWAVEWEDSAIEFLLSKGFTPDLGARPLRRAIDHYVLAPLSLTIVERRAPEGEQFLFVRRAGDRLQVEFVDPDSDGLAATTAAVEGTEPTAPLGVPRLMLHATGAAEEASFLVERAAAVTERVFGEAWARHKADKLLQMNHDGFWDRPDRYEVLGAIELMDRIESAATTLDSLTERLGRSPDSRALAERVAGQLYVIEEGLADHQEGRPGQALLGLRVLTEDREDPDARAFLDRLLEMYESWALRRRMRWTEVLPPERDPDVGAVFTVEGFGSHAILAREAGIHVFERPRDESKFDRIRARVTVTSHVPEEQASMGEKIRIAREELTGPDAQTTNIVRRYREHPSPLVRDNVAGWRTGRIDAVWRGDFDILG
jgi:ATP-dependent Clp protease ATP-binding subunit ClpC